METELGKITRLDIHDKMNWGPGPWQEEPDYLFYWVEKYPCLILRHGLGHLCGYVGIDKSKAPESDHYDDIDLEVHGDVTYGGNRDSELKPEDKESLQGKEYYWIGFDCAHYLDFMPASIAINRVLPETAKLRSQLFKSKDVYRTINFVKNEIQGMIDQLKKQDEKIK